MEKSQHTDFNKDTNKESASVACSNVQLWKLDSQKEWRNTSWRLWDERTESGFLTKLDIIKTWTGLPMEESVRMTEDRDNWRKYVHGVANPWIEDG